MNHTRRAIEAPAMGPQEPLLNSSKETRCAEDAHLTETHRLIRADPAQETEWIRDFDANFAFWRFIWRFLYLTWYYIIFY